MKFTFHSSYLVISLMALSASAMEYGTPGQPIELRIGYQPYGSSNGAGLVQKITGHWKKYLPKGSKVEFIPYQKGAEITADLLKGTIQIGYEGDVPTLKAITAPKIADIRIGAVNFFSNDQCNLLVTSINAPDFGKPEEALKWLDGKTIGVPFASCSEIFLRRIVEKYKVQPKAILNKSLSEIAQELKAGTLDAAVLWEMRVSQLSLRKSQN